LDRPNDLDRERAFCASAEAKNGPGDFGRSPSLSLSAVALLAGVSGCVVACGSAGWTQGPRDLDRLRDFDRERALCTNPMKVWSAGRACSLRRSLSEVALLVGMSRYASARGPACWTRGPRDLDRPLDLDRACAETMDSLGEPGRLPSLPLSVVAIFTGASRCAPARGPVRLARRPRDLDLDRPWDLDREPALCTCAETKDRPSWSLSKVALLVDSS